MSQLSQYLAGGAGGGDPFFTQQRMIDGNVFVCDTQAQQTLTITASAGSGTLSSVIWIGNFAADFLVKIVVGNRNEIFLGDSTAAFFTQQLYAQMCAPTAPPVALNIYALNDLNTAIASGEHSSGGPLNPAGPLVDVSENDDIVIFLPAGDFIMLRHEVTAAGAAGAGTCTFNVPYKFLLDDMQ